jgi:hypothetical protein
VYTTTFLKKEDSTMPKKMVRSRAKVKLFIWEGVLKDYSGGIAVSAARDIEGARAAIVTASKGYCRAEELVGEVSINPPTRILDIPAAAYLQGGS